MKNLAISVLLGTSLLFTGCGFESNNESVDYIKICHVENGRYYYLTNTGDKEMRYGYIDSPYITIDVRDAILSIKQFPCEVYLKKNAAGDYTEVKIVRKDEVK